MEIIRKNAVSRYLRHFLVLVPAPVLIVEAVNSVTHLTVYTERHIHTVDVSITGKLFKLKAMPATTEQSVKVLSLLLFQTFIYFNMF